MSNANVGAVYDHIIQEVINAVRVDFEENAVEEGVLEELKKVISFLSPPLPLFTFAPFHIPRHSNSLHLTQALVPFSSPPEIIASFISAFLPIHFLRCEAGD